MTILSADVEAWHRTLIDTYGQKQSSSVLVADGYGLSLTVEAGHLLIADGVGQHRRVRRLSRVERSVRRIVVLGRAGTITLAALRWCTDVGIAVAVIDPDGTLTAVTAAPNPRDARLRRAQALASNSPIGLHLAKGLLRAKLEGQAAVLHERLQAVQQAAQLREAATTIDDCTTIENLREIEARAANAYFVAWAQKVRVSFARREEASVPAHWHQPTPRRSPLGGASSPRRAADPVNAMLNYAYTLGEAACRHACLVVGLDPALGVMHADRAHRDSMALDLLEPLRPTIDLHILDVLEARRFRKVDFIETPDGQCRLTEAVTHSLTAALPAWEAIIAPTVEDVAHSLAQSSKSRIRLRTPLTQAIRLEARVSDDPRRGVRRPTMPVVTRSCQDCGIPVTDQRRKRCPDCWVVERTRLATLRAEHGRAQRTASIATGQGDPTQTTQARDRRAASLVAERKLRDAWDRLHQNQAHDRAAFQREIQPGLATVPLSSIVRTTGVSDSAASRIRSGALMPHPRHWQALRQLTDAEH